MYYYTINLGPAFPTPNNTSKLTSFRFCVWNDRSIFEDTLLAGIFAWGALGYIVVPMLLTAWLCWVVSWLRSFCSIFQEIIDLLVAKIWFGNRRHDS